MTTNTGGPAFPAPAGVQHITDQGMTLRDYFAAKAMPFVFGSNIAVSAWEDRELTIKAVQAYRIADAMLKARQV